MFAGELQNTTEESDIAKMMQQFICKLPITSDKKVIFLEAVNNIDKNSPEEKIAKEKTPYLVAAKHGIVEITRILQSKLKSVIHERNLDNENVLLLAVRYRQPQVVQQLRDDKVLDNKIFESLCTQVDKDENTMLHLAAFESPSKETTWKMAGPAMQMMWDVKWYKVCNTPFSQAKKGIIYFF
jgi:ankyrin repeat protein